MGIITLVLATLLYVVTAAEGSERAKRMEQEFAVDRDDAPSPSGRGRRR